ncbi:hypothetical protein [Staphylococcus intermedius]|uniref:hypothetical protein n=1 Tax=Staphylococcus intermedius TaxID=1285 RepID=UPI000BBC720A|nr:hypothetical protein [Staphylococcus intermedius]PCF86312.1 hypothetical protein B4W76_08700 [Staphylococcus intermedius]
MGIQHEAQASENGTVETDNSKINSEATNTESKNTAMKQPSDATQPEVNENTNVTTNKASETPEDTNDEGTSYTAKQYPDQDTNSIAVENDADDKKDTDKDGALTYFKEQNGYVPEQTQTVKNGVKTSEHCTADEVTTEYTNKVNLNAKSVMDTNLDDYSNNGFQEKMKNPNNHPNATDVNSYGPGNLEVQHWQTGSNEATTSQNWIIVFATDYAIDNGVMRVTLPYDNVTTSDASNWLVNRYYPAVSRDGKSSYTNVITPENITFDGNIAIINLGNVAANSAYGIVFNKQFDTPQDFSNGPLTTSINVSGEWNEEDLRRQLELKKNLCVHKACLKKRLIK